MKRLANAVVGDARECLRELSADRRRLARTRRLDRARRPRDRRRTTPTSTRSPRRPRTALPTYAQVVGAIDRLAEPHDYALTAAGGFPGELNNGWRAKALDSFDCEYGFSCMGYEISGAWGAKMALPDREVISFVGDGSYLMMNTDLYSSVLAGHKLIVIVCDNGGFAVIHRLQVNQGGAGFNNLLEDTRHRELVRVDFAAHARRWVASAETVSSIAELEAAFGRARASDRTYVIALQTEPERMDRGRDLLGGRRARGQRPGRGARRRARRWTRERKRQRLV